MDAKGEGIKDSNLGRLSTSTFGCNTWPEHRVQNCGRQFIQAINNKIELANTADPQEIAHFILDQMTRYDEYSLYELRIPSNGDDS